MVPQTNSAWILLTVIALLISARNWIQISEDSDTHPTFEYTHQGISQPLKIPVYREDQVNVPPIPLNLNIVEDLVGEPKVISDSGLKGSISYAVLVDEYGNYNKHLILGEPHPLFEVSTEPFIPFLTFEPARLDGKEVRCWITVHFSF